MQSLLERVEHEVSFDRARYPPADDAAGEYIDHEGHEDDLSRTREWADRRSRLDFLSLFLKPLCCLRSQRSYYLGIRREFKPSLSFAEIQIPEAALTMQWKSILTVSVLLASTGCVHSIRSTTNSLCGGASTNTSPLMVPNPDGTITVTQRTSMRDSSCSEAGNGLTIPAQIVAPTVRTSDKSPL
jgi:hypothetical protein